MIVCADDYGLRDDINRAILELCASGRLSAVSCMAGLERCAPGPMAELLVYQRSVDVGLHLCLTDEGLPLCASPARGGAMEPLPSFGVLLRRALLGQVRPREMARLISAQYELFVTKCQRRPDFIDGHLHAHQLPGVREGLLEFVLSLPKADRPYVRNTHLPLRELWRRRLPWVKAAFIGAFGARMQKQLRAAGAATNEGFAGIYDFGKWRQYPEYLPRFTACLRSPNSLLVVHPGGNEDWRRQEFAALRGFPFATGMPNRLQHS